MLASLALGFHWRETATEELGLACKAAAWHGVRDAVAIERLPMFLPQGPCKQDSLMKKFPPEEPLQKQYRSNHELAVV